ncbi:MAG: hypothetical protein NVS1B10_04410 [Candidatus Saccharimonadales bacterium]
MVAVQSEHKVFGQVVEVVEAAFEVVEPDHMPVAALVAAVDLAADKVVRVMSAAWL